MVFVLAVLLLLPVTSVQAGTISTGTNLIKMESVSINDSHAYTDTIAVSNCTYVVKVTDYEGAVLISRKRK